MSAERAVIFDFDGVLADTERLHYAAFRDVLREYGWTLGEPDYFERYLGYDDAGLVNEFARDHQLALAPPARTAILHQKAEVFRTRLTAAGVLYPGATAAVQRLGSKYRLGIASGSLADEIFLVLDATALRSAFGVVVGADNVARSKPAPDPYAKAVHSLGVAPASAVAIEDSRGGLESAQKAGLRTIAITTSSPAALLASADHVVSSLDEVTLELVATLLDS